VASPDGLRVRLGRFTIFVAGVVATHLALYAPSLLGYKVLLPLEDLAGARTYLPRTPEYSRVIARYPALSDQVVQFEFQRRFAAQEFRAGRVPLWDPNNYCGAPFVVPFFSPYNIPYYLFPHYITLAWTHVLVALVAAGGAYVFFRRVLGVGFWPAAIAAWCFPLTGFFQLWLGYYLSYTASFLPWLLVAVDGIVRRPGGWGGPALVVLTASVVISGAADLAGQALLASGLYSLWLLAQLYRKDKHWRPILTRAIVLTGAWAVGILLAAPYLWPLLEYMPTGLRMQRRAGNFMERPPVGITSLLQMVLPLSFGSTEREWIWLSPAPNLQESSAQAYCGLIVMLVLAPLGLANRRFRSLNFFWVLLCILTSAWVLNLWPLTLLLQLPGLNLMSHNRFLFVFDFAVLALAATGLDAVARGEIRWNSDLRRPLIWVMSLGAWCVASHYILWHSIAIPSGQQTADQQLVIGVLVLLAAGSIVYLVRVVLEPQQRSAFVIPVVVLVGLCGWCLMRVAQANSGLSGGVSADSASEAQALIAAGRVKIGRYSTEAAVLCAMAALLWAVAFRCQPRVAVGVLGVAAIAEVLWLENGQNPQSDPALYYPPLAPLTKLAAAPEGRIAGMAALPPMLPQAYGLRDVRGYDAVDPARIVRLLVKLQHQKAMKVDYAMTQWWFPRLLGDSRTMKFKCLPALSMLNLRYMVGRDKLPPGPSFEPLLINEDDYWVYENPEAMPRLYVPASVEVLSEAKTLALLTDLGPSESAFKFDPRAVAYVESEPRIPGPCRGSAKITAETPCELHVSVNMETPGLLVLADQWYPGWKAYYNGTQVPVVPANYALRGVRLPAGQGEVVFRYEPAGWRRGLTAFSVAAIALALWSAATFWTGRRTRLHAIVS
jgi:hypothetical protein